MPKRSGVPISIGGRVFTMHDGIFGPTPLFVRKVRDIAEKIPNGQLWTTRDILAKAGYMSKKAGLLTHPLLAPYRYQYSYHTILWGNKKEIAYAKKVAESSNRV